MEYIFDMTSLKIQINFADTTLTINNKKHPCILNINAIILM